MKPFMVTMSGLPRVRKCAPSAVLPRAFAVPTVDSIWGSEVHRFLMLVPELGRDIGLEHIADEDFRERLAEIDLSALPASKPEEFAAEVSWAYNWRTGEVRELGRGLGTRDYSSVTADEIPGTADSVGLSADEVSVWDYKVGWADLGEVGNNWQLLAYALAAARCYGKSRARVTIARKREDGTWWFQSAVVSEMELDGFEFELRALLESLPTRSDVRAAADLPVVEGAHCKYCPAFDSCPAKVSLARALGGATVSKEAAEQMWPAITNENAAAVLQRLQLAKEVLSAVESALEEFSDTTPIDIGGGKKWGPVQEDRYTYVPHLASHVVRQMYEPDIAEAVISDATKTTVKMSKADVEKALRKHWLQRTPGGKITKAVEAFEERMREAGAGNLTHIVKYRAFNPDKEKTKAEKKEAKKKKETTPTEEQK